MRQAVIISGKELRRLAGLRSEQGILSTYLKLDPRLTYARGQHIAKFKGALKRFIREAGDPWLSSVAERERDGVLEFLELWQPRGRSLVIFSSQPGNIRELLRLDVLVPTFVTVDRTANIGLLAQVLDEYPRFAVAVVQRDHAMLYITEQRLAEGLPEILSDVPGRHDQGGWSQARFQRHIEFHYGLHLNRLVEQLAGNLREEDERRSERELVDQIVGAAESGGQGVAGIDGTLQALLDGRVHVLAVAEGIAAAGCECLSCGYFAAKGGAEGPAGGG